MARRSSSLAIAIPALVVGAAALGALSFFYGPTAVSNLAPENNAAPAVESGFVGASIFGDWELLCTPGPEHVPTPAPLDKPDLAAPAATESACRVRHEAIAARVPETAAGETATAPDGTDSVATDAASAPTTAANPPQVILTVSLSLVGPTKRPALMLRLPATLKPDDVVTLRDDDSFAIDAVVRECDEQECMAADSLTDEEWMRLVAADTLQVVFPFDETQLVSVDVGVNGLPAAVAALIEAQTN